MVHGVAAPGLAARPYFHRYTEDAVDLCDVLSSFSSQVKASRVRRGMIQLAWRFLLFQKNSALAQWFRARTENARGTRKPMIVALARKLLIALWRLVREGVVPDGVVLRPTQ